MEVKIANKLTSLVPLGLIMAACNLLYPPLAIVHLLHAPLWTGFHIVQFRVEVKERLKRAFEIMIPYTAAVLLALPYLLSVSSESAEPVIRIAFWDQSIRNNVLFWLPAPFIMYGVWVSYRKLSPTKWWFLIIGAFLCFSLSTFTRVALWNSGKFTFILSFFYAMFFLFAASGLLQKLSGRIIKGILTTGMILFLAITPVLTEAAYIVSPWFHDNTYSFSGRHVEFAEDKVRNEAYTWLRDNSPPDALIMLSYSETTIEDSIAQNITYEPSALTERNLYAIKDWYTFSNPEYMKRVVLKSKLFSDTGNSEAVRGLLELDRPLYLLLEDSLAPIYMKERMFESFNFNPSRFKLVFTNGRQHVYEIKLH